ncbi:MAG TPA: tetratricopeptide repeat protein [Chloroflexia bacterium]|nr:tetratricopeptide repeat protein [Chloroflexia bacterium]
MQDLPTGTVTFLATDIEASMRRWERAPQEMRPAVQRHDGIVREAIEAQGGRIFHSAGDGFIAAFATPPPALAAALAAQRALQAEPWPAALGPLRVRMALHAGPAEWRAGEYAVQPPVNRLVRLLTAAHGEQILLSAAVRQELGAALPAGVTLRDLGERRLRDMLGTLHIFQVVAAGLRREFPPLKTLDPHPANLPAPPTPLIGREAEVAAATTLLRDPAVRLVTFTGPGGTGKTRLSLAVATHLIDDFADGVCFVDLAPVRDPARVAAALATALEVREVSRQPLLPSLKASLGDKHLLLVLDNFEQVVAAASLVAELLAAAPRLVVLVTSRIRLRLRSEHTVPVAPLPLPGRGARLAPTQLRQNAALRLFEDRARAAQPAFVMTDDILPIIATICARLDGLPLAIELAAARSRSLSPATLAQRLDQRLPLLRSGSRDLPRRQQTLRGAIAWSYDLLTPAEQQVFRRLAVFAGGGTLDAAAVVVGEPPADPGAGPGQTVGAALVALVEQSLVRQQEPDGGPARFGLLETIREFAGELLAASGEAAAIQARHAAYYMTVVEQTVALTQGPHQVTWLDRLEQEYANITAALEWSIRADGAALALRLGAELWRFWDVRGYLSIGRHWLETALAVGQDQPAAVRAAALYGASRMAWLQGDYAQAQQWIAASLALWRVLDNPTGIAQGLHVLGIVLSVQGDYAQARAYCEESLARWRALGHQANVVRVLNSLGQIARGQEDYAQAHIYGMESLALARSLGNERSIAATLVNLGYVALAQQDLARATALFSESLGIRRQLGHQAGMIDCLAGLAAVAGQQGHLTRAAHLFGAVAAWRESLSYALDPEDQVVYDRELAAVRTRLAPAAFADAWYAGQARALDDLVAAILEQRDPLGAE